jgi:hypothetical protein
MLRRTAVSQPLFMIFPWIALTLMSDFTQWYDHNYPFLSGHGTWLRGGEINSVDASHYDSAQFRVLFARLSTYRDTATSFTHQLLYELAQGVSGCFADIAYLPPPRDGELMQRDCVPWLLGTQTKRGPRDFDLIGLSNAILMELSSLPALLDRSAIPLGKAARMADEQLPLLLLGGANALHTSALFGPDPLVDIIFVGEDSATISRLLTISRDAKRRGLSKRELLSALTQVEGVFEPDILQPATRVVAPQVALLRRGLVSFEAEAAGHTHLPISEGCPWSCSFCAESWARKPYRETRVEDAIEAARALKRSTGAHAIDLFSFNFNIHSRFYELYGGVNRVFSSVGLKSQRFDMLAQDRQLLPFLLSVGKSSITCGLEGISVRLRHYLDKGLNERHFEHSLLQLLQAKVRELKIFLIATGREEEQDFIEFKELLRSMSLTCGRLGRQMRIIFSMTPLVRFCWTPQEYEDASGAGAMREIVLQTERIVNGHGFEFRASAGVQEYRIAQILARADTAAVSEAVVELYRQTGFVYYEGVPETVADCFEQLLTERGFEPATLLKAPEVGQSRCWDHLAPGVDKSRLQKRHLRFSAPPTVGEEREEEQDACDIALDFPDETLLAARPRRASARSNEVVVIGLTRTERSRGISGSVMAMAIAGALMRSAPELTDSYRGCRGSGLEQRFGTAWVFGDDHFETEWDSSGATLLRSLIEQEDFRQAFDIELGGWGSYRAETTSEALRIEIRSPFACNASSYCQERHLKHTFRRAASGGATYEFTKDALRRKLLRSLTVEQEASGQSVVHLTPLERFELGAFVQECFCLPSAEEWVRLLIKVGT